jgi:hypothetical protein
VIPFRGECSGRATRLRDEPTKRGSRYPGGRRRERRWCGCGIYSCAAPRSAAGGRGPRVDPSRKGVDLRLPSGTEEGGRGRTLRGGELVRRSLTHPPRRALGAGRGGGRRRRRRASERARGGRRACVREGVRGGRRWAMCLGHSAKQMGPFEFHCLPHR